MTGRRLEFTAAANREAVRDNPALRTFGYASQATILARFEPGRLIVMRVYFTGQDWSRGQGRR